MGFFSRGAFPPLFADMHSHLLPGIDDGARDVAESAELIDGLRSLGYRKLVTTPHIYQELYPNSRQTLEQAYRLLPETSLPLQFAAEYYLDEHVEKLLKAGEPLLPIHDNWILTETSFVQPPPDLDRRLFDLQVAGYKPIIAHPERYPFWHTNHQVFHEFRDRGLLLQINLLSLTGYYGREALDTAKYLIREGLVDLAGTDCHHMRHIDALRKDAGTIGKWLDPLLKKDKLLNVVL
jgi:protein-tyrosine phosphatase